MIQINNILIVGLGALGSLLASSIIDSKSGNLKILLDNQRFQKYINSPTYFNDKLYNFDYILPESNNFKADLVIISTKYNGLDFAIDNVEKFVHKDTVFISLLNGVNSERQIAQKYSDKNVITSFYIGHSCIRKDRKIYQDGVYEIVLGINNSCQESALSSLINFFQKANIHYRISSSIMDEYWKKFMINVGLNQVCALFNMTLKQIKSHKDSSSLLINLMKEADLIAEKVGIINHKQILDSAITFLFDELEDACPSMLQDILAKRFTEVDIFAGEIIKLGQKYNIPTPYNSDVYYKIKLIQNNLKV